MDKHLWSYGLSPRLGANGKTPFLIALKNALADCNQDDRLILPYLNPAIERYLAHMNKSGCNVKVEPSAYIS